MKTQNSAGTSLSTSFGTIFGKWRAVCATVLIAAAALVTAAVAAHGQSGTAASSTSATSTSKSSAPSQTAKPKPAGTAASSSAVATKPGTATTAKSAPVPLTTDKAKDSYALGANVGRQLSQNHLQLNMIDTSVFLKGFKDALQGTQPQMTDEQVHAALNQLQSQMIAKADAANAVIGEANLKEGQDFLAQNKTKQGVTTLPSGLQYKVITMGTGPKPTPSDTVVCDYRGTLINGKEFDSSYKRGQPASFPVNGVIKGWTEALQLMPVGSKWELFVPAEMAYGGRGAGPDIGPNATLIFEVELKSIKGK
jgi:FKBP-type peptidyl-prolyl cis-trans isomerase